jgi:serine/threonine protein kinase
MQILNGVSYMHRLGLAHRDLKLENVVVTERGIIKLVDFGCAAIFRDPHTRKQIFSTDVVGCSSYMAPEIFQRRPYAPQYADVWSLGIMYCCMVLGRFPWKVALPTVDAFKRFATSQTSEANLQGGNSQESFDKTVVSTSFEDVSGKGDTRIVIQTSEIVERQNEETKDDEGSGSLLRTLPAESRLVIGGMLQVVPQRRPNLQEICDSIWATQSDVCSQDGQGKVYCSGKHQHTLRGR